MGLRLHICRVLAALIVLLAVAPAGAQDAAVLQSQIVTVDSELVFATTSVGQGITISLESQVSALAAENGRIAADLEAEELALTEQRKQIEPSEFRLLADEFDQKVRRIRSEQDAKQRALQDLRDSERQSFVDAIGPILSSIARRHGAVVVLERRNVLLSADSIDITEEVIDAINLSLASENDGQGDTDAGTQRKPADGNVSE